MVKGTRITMTKSQVESPAGKRLVDLILSICHDGSIEAQEVEALHQFLQQADSGIAAIGYLRAFTREMLADGALDGAESYRLKQAFQRVVPKDVRGVVSTHLEAIGLPFADPVDEQPEWFDDEATSRQIQYIVDLGGTVRPGLKKGAASTLIQELLERRPPTPRQKMLLRFFDRLDLIDTSKDDVSNWLDELFTMNPSYELAWQRYKHDTMQDPDCQDADAVPIAAFRRYVAERSPDSSDRAQKPGCAAMIACVVFLGFYLVRSL